MSYFKQRVIEKLAARLSVYEKGLELARKSYRRGPQDPKGLAYVTKGREAKRAVKAEKKKENRRVTQAARQKKLDELAELSPAEKRHRKYMVLDRDLPAEESWRWLHQEKPRNRIHKLWGGKVPAGETVKSHRLRQQAWKNVGVGESFDGKYFAPDSVPDVKLAGPPKKPTFRDKVRSLFTREK